MRPAQIRAVASAALTHAEEVASAIDPGYQISGEEILLLNPTRSDRSRGSFSFNRKKGVWKEYSGDGEGGSDLVSLWAYCRRLSTMSAAAADLALHLGLSLDGMETLEPARCQQADYEVKPAPPEALDEIPRFLRWAMSNCHATGEYWILRDGEGRPVRLRVRVEPPGKNKNVLPASWITEKKQWRFGGAFAGMLYGLEKLKDSPASRVLLLEGEKTTDAARTLFPDYVTLGFMGTSSVRRVALDPLFGRNVTILPDACTDGEEAARTLAGRLSELGVHVCIVELPTLVKDWIKPGKVHPGGWDVADPLPMGLRIEELRRIVTDAKPYRADSSCVGRVPILGPYKEEGGCIWYEVAEKKPLKLANFAARITKEITRDDGFEEQKVFAIEGRLVSGENLRRIDVSAAQFGSMSWVPTQWGARAIVSAANGCLARLREAIQLMSAPGSHTVYTHLGWRAIRGECVYLSRGGAVGKSGFVSDVEVDPVENLSGFALPDIRQIDLPSAIQASLSLLELAPHAITVPVLLACYRAPMGRASFALHLVGETGSRKSSLQAIAQSHWGTKFTFGNLPGNWASTRTALELLIFQAKDALLCIDNLVPPTSKQERDRLFDTVSKIIQSIGDGSGRDRCNDAATLRHSRPPRALVLSSGEDLPQGHSAFARMLLIEVRKGDVDLSKLSRLQADASGGKLAASLAGYLKWLAPQMDGMSTFLNERIQELRPLFPGGHGRTTDAVASLFVGGESFLRFALEAGAIGPREAIALKQQFLEALRGITEHQVDAQGTVDPVRRFLDLLPALFLSGRAHLKGIRSYQPQDSVRFGWTRIPRAHDALDNEPRGECIGWYDEEDQMIYLEDTSTYAAVERLAGASGESIPMSRCVLWKRLAEKGKLLRDPDGKHLKRKVPGQGNQRALAMKVASIPAWASDVDSECHSHLLRASHPFTGSGEAENLIRTDENPRFPEIPVLGTPPPPPVDKVV